VATPILHLKLMEEQEDTLDMPLRLNEDLQLVRIRSFGIGFRWWIRIGQDLSL
jgi:hypothetical protein